MTPSRFVLFGFAICLTVYIVGYATAEVNKKTVRIENIFQQALECATYWKGLFPRSRPACPDTLIATAAPEARPGQAIQ